MTSTEELNENGQDLRQVLIIDDDIKLCRLIRDYLGPLGYAVEAVHDGREGVEAALSKEWHAVLLDVMLPGLDGFEVLQAIRSRSTVPVLMLTARGEEPDRIVGLEMGADDYLPKTFSTRELLARLRAVARRRRAAVVDIEADEEEVCVQDLRIRPASRTVTLGDRPLELTPVEYDLLWALARSPGRIKTREQLLEEVRERHFDVFDRSVDVHVSALRRKLGDSARDPVYIRTVRSAGYLLIDPRREPS